MRFYPRVKFCHGSYTVSVFKKKVSDRRKRYHAYFCRKQR